MDVTPLLRSSFNGDELATAHLLPLLYDELRELACAKLANEKVGQTLNATGLVHEAFLRLVKNGDQQKWESRGHLFAAAAETMRRILVDIARRKKRLRHGGGRKRLKLDSLKISGDMSEEWADELLDLDAVLDIFAVEHPVEAEVVKLRYFGGLTMEDTANALGMSRRTAQRYWAFARAWLFERVQSRDHDGAT